jgi:DNA-dependent protein kinase catalytic subunit
LVHFLQTDYALQLILSYGEGKISILKFLINTLSQGKGKFTPCVKKAFSIIQMLCKSYPEKVRKYAQDIVDISTIFINQEKVYATEKESAAQTIYEILNSEASSKGIKLEQVLETLMIFLGHKDLPERLQKHLYVICGLISKNHPKEVKEFQAKELRDLMINRIISLYKDDKAKPSLTAIGGAIEGLNYHLQNFTPSHDEDPEFGNKLYECMIWLTDTKKAEDFSRRESFRKMLELIYNFANIYDIPLKFFNQYSSWQETFKHWINSKLYDDTVAGVHAMQKFHELISTVIETRKDPDDKKVLNYFVRYFKATLQDQNSQPHEIRIAIKGFGAMAGACKILEETNYLSELFDLIMQQTEYSYFTNDRLKRREVLEHLPNYVQSLSRIMNHLKEITGIQLQSLQSIIVVLIKDFHFLSSSHHALVPVSLMETFLNLQKLGK